MAEKEYVEREVLIDRVEEIDWYHIGSQGDLARGACSDGDTPLYKADDIYEALESVPAADVVEVRHGKWKKVSEKYPRYVCTACDHLYNNKEYKHCPFCGAKMDGKEGL